MRKSQLTLFLFGALSIITGYAQDSVKTYKRFRVTPLPVIYYSPETRLGFGALVAANFETIKKPDSITLSSYAQTYFYIRSISNTIGERLLVSIHQRTNSSSRGNSITRIFRNTISALPLKNRWRKKTR